MDFLAGGKEPKLPKLQGWISLSVSVSAPSTSLNHHLTTGALDFHGSEQQDDPTRRM